VHTNDPTATITSVITATLDVPGATLHYQVRGTGPMMLMICRGISDADLLAHLAQRLADQFTVVPTIGAAIPEARRPDPRYRSGSRSTPTTPTAGPSSSRVCSTLRADGPDLPW
jgi:hypothetical protein